MPELPKPDPRDLTLLFWDRPIEVIDPWFSAEIHRGNLSREKESKTASGLPYRPHRRIERTCESKSLPLAEQFPIHPRSPDLYFSLISPDARSNLCIAECNSVSFLYSDIAVISMCVGCKAFIFHASHINGMMASSFFSVFEKGRLGRHVGVDWEEDAQGLISNVFFQKGSTQPWEKNDRYLNSEVALRLPRDLLIEYIEALGLDFLKYQDRAFDRIIDFFPIGEGDNLVGYADKIPFLEAASDSYFSDNSHFP